MASTTRAMPSTLTPVRENTTSPQTTPLVKKRTQELLDSPGTPPPPKEVDFKSHKHPWLSRKAFSEGYDKPVTEREGWWRTYIRETPLPGAYDSKHFLEDLVKKPNTYRFRSDGRKLDPHPHGKGAVLLPGAYDFQHFLEHLDKNPATYNFKATDRSKQNFLVVGQRDKDINISPNAYTTETFQSLTSDKQPSKHSMFKSHVKRFPTMPFRPREGPGPGNYEYFPEKSKVAVSSSFKSRTPRFSTSHTRVPGPGTYEKTYQNPQPETIAKMGRQHGLFFSSAFHVK